MKRFAICVCLAGAIAGEALPAQAAPGALGTVVALIPRMLIGTDEYWVYANGRLVSAPPHAPFSEPTFGAEGDYAAIRTSMQTLELRDGQGIAVRIDTAHIGYIRPGLTRGAVAQTERLRLAPGEYVVELVTLRSGKQPFSISRSTVSVEQGKEIRVELPATAAPGRSRTALERATVHRFAAPQEELDSHQRAFDDIVKQYEASPVAVAMAEVLAKLSLMPPNSSTTYVNLPDSLGGGRELDARQVQFIVDQLVATYSFRSIADDTHLRNAAPPIPQEAEALEARIAEHNHGIEALRRIVTLLQQARKGGEY